MSVERFNDLASGASRRAMALTGIERNLSAFARKLNQVAGGEGTTHSSVRRWLEGGTIPAWALMAAADAAGVSVGSLLEEAPSDLAQEVAHPAEEIRRLWAAVSGATRRATRWWTGGAPSTRNGPAAPSSFLGGDGHAEEARVRRGRIELRSRSFGCVETHV
ncbi:MAG: hypothetical protein J2P57_11835 [Acidimicrobiaceae bacterium]|nr:hypothetical protein [Acidimicrobiaceae bacterium]